MRKAKIVCTTGPATETAEQIRALVDAGMDVARINRSHGAPAEHEAVIRHVRAAAKASGRAVAVLVDLQGPKIRLGRFAEDKVQLDEGDIFTITTEDVPGTKELASTTYKGLPGDARVGDRILIDDGRVTVRITAVEGPRVVTRVEVGGPISNNKGLNLPGVAVSVPAKDEEDLRWALRLGADFIALSFVRSAADYDDVARVMTEEGRTVPVIAKIEKPQAVDNLVEIIEAFDGIMVARGDLGVELPLEMVPIVQKRAIELARRSAKPVIVATEVLESMISSPRQLDGSLLHDRDHLERQLDPQVTASDHEAVKRFDDLDQVVHRLRLLDLGDDRDRATLLRHDPRDVVVVGGAADEGQGDEVGAQAKGPAQVLLVLGGHADGNARQVEALVVGDRPTYLDPGDHPRTLDSGDPDSDPTVVDQDPVADPRVARQALVRGRGELLGPRHVLGGDGEHVALVEVHLVFSEAAEADLRTLQVDQHGD